MPDPQVPVSAPAASQSGGIIDKIINSMSDLITAQGKVIGKAIEVQGSLIDAATRNATSVLTTFTNKVNDALGNVWVGKK